MRIPFDLKRDIRSLTSENSELKIRYQGMEKQVQLSDGKLLGFHWALFSVSTFNS